MVSFLLDNILQNNSSQIQETPRQDKALHNVSVKNISNNMIFSSNLTNT